MKHGENTSDIKGSQVVIVDDNKDLLQLCAYALKINGCVPKTFDNGEDALRSLRNADELPALVVTDLMMPEMSGADLIREIRADSRLKDLSVVLSSASTELIQTARESGATDFLRKPFSLDQFFRLVRATMAH